MLNFIFCSNIDNYLLWLSCYSAMFYQSQNTFLRMKNVVLKIIKARQISCTFGSKYSCLFGIREFLGIKILQLKCCWSVTKSCPVLHDPAYCSMPGFPVPHCLLEFVQVQVHGICDVIQPSHPLLPSSPSAFNLSQLQGYPS